MDNDFRLAVLFCVTGLLVFGGMTGCVIKQTEQCYSAKIESMKAGNAALSATIRCGV